MGFGFYALLTIEEDGYLTEEWTYGHANDPHSVWEQLLKYRGDEWHDRKTIVGVRWWVTRWP